MLIGVDTNVLLDQAAQSADVLDALTVIRERLNADFIVPPTVLEELAFQALNAGGLKGETARKALICMREWGVRSAKRCSSRKGDHGADQFKTPYEGDSPR